MGAWSEYLLCSHKYDIIPLRSGSVPVPDGMKALLQQHSEDDDLAGDGSTYPETIQLEDIFRSFSCSSRIMGYLTPDYVNKWKDLFAYLEKHIHWGDDESDLWVMFYCEDYGNVYTLAWDRSAKQVRVRETKHLTRSLGV